MLFTIECGNDVWLRLSSVDIWQIEPISVPSVFWSGTRVALLSVDFPKSTVLCRDMNLDLRVQLRFGRLNQSRIGNSKMSTRPSTS